MAYHGSHYLFYYTANFFSDYFATRMKTISLGTSIVAVLVVWFIILGQLENVIAIFEGYDLAGIALLLLISGILAVLWVFKIKELVEES